MENESESENAATELIPGIPDDIAEFCIVRVPYPYHALARSVSSSWNRSISHPSFVLSRTTLSLPTPHLFVFAIHKETGKTQWQTLDPSTRRWLVLPQMPLRGNFSPSDTPFACTSLPSEGKLFFMGGLGPVQGTFIYRTAMNQWSTGKLIPLRIEPFLAEGVCGKVVVIGADGTDVYDAETDTWRMGRDLAGELSRYESTVANGKIYITEGWWWPFVYRPRGWVYDVERDTWRPMGVGMRDGWTGLGVTVRGRILVIADYGDYPIKVYDEDNDTWRMARGEKFPKVAMKRPFSAKAIEDRIYVAALGLNVAIGTVVFEDDGDVKLTWQVVEGPHAFRELSPLSCQVVYA